MWYIKKIISFCRLRIPALALYFIFFNMKTRTLSRVRHIVNPILIRLQIRKGYINIFLDSDWLGLGARLVKLLEILYFAKLNNVVCNVEFGYKQKKKSSYLLRLFTPVNKNFYGQRKYIRIEDTTELRNGMILNNLLDIRTANELLLETYIVNELVQSEVDAFISNNFLNEKTLGVHFRGTDKIGEAARFNEDDLIIEIRNLLVSQGFTKIFISTDEFSVLEKLKNEIADVPVVYRDDTFRSKNGEQFHRVTENPKDLINHEAIVNILLLSRTDFLLKTASIMSDFCIIFNPDLPYRILSIPRNDTLTWWPARELICNSSQ